MDAPWNYQVPHATYKRLLDYDTITPDTLWEGLLMPCGVHIDAPLVPAHLHLRSLMPLPQLVTLK